MTEAEWLACNDPTKMLKFLRGRASERKLRLFACACCRRIWPRYWDERSRRVVEIGERFADGEVTFEELRIAGQLTWETAREAGGGLEMEDMAVIASSADVAEADAFTAASQGSEACRGGANSDRTLEFPDEDRFLEEEGPQADLLRDIFGYLLPRGPVKVRLDWNNSTIPKLARIIYDSRSFSDLPILADALEEAGCIDPYVLAHCRQAGEHVRGCWVVDLILGKK